MRAQVGARLLHRRLAGADALLQRVALLNLQSLLLGLGNAALLGGASLRETIVLDRVRALHRSEALAG
jgi:hypothetical protein